MKRNLVAGLFATGLIIAGGTGAYVAYAKDNANSKVMMGQQGMGTNQMVQMMNSKGMQEMMNSNDMQTMMNSMDTKALSEKDWKDMQQLMQSKDYSFDHMLPYMKKMHPNLSNEELKSFYDKMHGKDGTASCSNLMQENTGEK
ncbi:MAG: hypothetical protein Q8934_20110 [Bacillota bacterium]|nr:hypothetical protein [Bacillota bacterium]